MRRPPEVLVVLPSLRTEGGTEGIVAQGLAALRRRGARLGFVVPRSRVVGERLPPGEKLFAIEVPELPGFLWEEAWFRRATRAVRALRRAYPIRFSPGMNALGVTHTHVHAIFAQWAEIQRAHLVPHPRELQRLARFRRIAAWERRLYTDRRVHVAAVSLQAAALLRRRYERDDVVALPPAVDRRRFSARRRGALRRRARAELGLGSDEPFVLFVGNSWLTKGLDLLLCAWTRASREGEAPGVLGVVGTETAEYVTARAGCRPPGVRWLPWRPDVERYYAAADLVVLPSRGETFGLPIAEAGLMGVPVLVSDRAGVADYVDPTAVVPALDAESWRERITALLSDGERRRMLAVRVRRRLSESLPDDDGEAFASWLLGTHAAG